jgi:chondroitin 4-sulfotransferase 11
MVRRARMAARRRSEDSRFVFIHINKTGGSSIERALNLPFEHKTALEKIEEIGQEAWEERFSFAVVRNPWDKVVSHYHYRLKRNTRGLKEDGADFPSWVESAYGRQDPKYFDNPKMFMPQSDWITDAEGNCLVDFVCRFESLRDDFATVCQKIGVEAELPHVKASSHEAYQTYYNDAARAVVAQCFESDIQRFGYQF